MSLVTGGSEFAAIIYFEPGASTAKMECGDRLALPRRGRVSVFATARTASRSAFDPALPQSSWVAIVHPSHPVWARWPGDTPGGPTLASRELTGHLPVVRLRPDLGERDVQAQFGGLAGGLYVYAARNLSGDDFVPLSHLREHEQIAKGEPLLLLSPSEKSHIAVTADGMHVLIADADVTVSPPADPVWPATVRSCRTIEELIAEYATPDVAGAIAAFRSSLARRSRQVVENTDQYMAHTPYLCPPCPGPGCSGVTPEETALLQSLSARRLDLLEADLQRIRSSHIRL